MALRELKRFVVLRVHFGEGGPRIALDSDWENRENAETYVQQKNDAEQMWVCEVVSAFTRKMVREAPK